MVWIKRLLVAVFAVATLAPQVANAAPGPAPIDTWSSRLDTIQEWLAQDSALASEFFDPGVRYRTPEMKSWVGNSVLIHSLEGFARRAPRLADGTVVMYNPEAEPVTPRWEKRHPRWAMRKFVRVAHENGLFAVLAPAKTLAAPDPRCSTFLECGYLRIPSDAFHLQAQKLECDLPVFTDFVSRAKALSVSPLIVQLTVGWDVPCVTAEVVRDAWRAALPWADGYALWGGATAALNAKGLEAMRLISQEVSV
jgi:hypothetical protein